MGVIGSLLRTVSSIAPIVAQREFITQPNRRPIGIGALSRAQAGLPDYQPGQVLFYYYRLLMERDIESSLLPELHVALRHRRRDAKWIYRGHPDPQWELVPRASPPPFI